MQTFLPYADFEESAFVLDTRRLGKQRVETLQIMQSLFGVRLISSYQVHTGKMRRYLTDENGKKVKEKDLVPDGLYFWNEEEIILTKPLPMSEWQLVPPDNPGWANHPAVNMWRGHEGSLMNYQKAVCDEWTINGGYVDTCLIKTSYIYLRMTDGWDYKGPPSWLGDEAFHISHRSNLIQKDPKFYTKYFPDTPDDLPYVWPIP